MTLPDIDTNGTFGGSLNDYSAVIDPTTDRPASGANPAYADVAMATHTLPRALVRFTTAGAGTPVLAASGFQWDAVWSATTVTAPVIARTGAGVYTVTFPATVADEIPLGAPGYNAAGHNVNFRGGHCAAEGANNWLANVTITSPNVATVNLVNPTNGATVDPNPGTFLLTLY